MSTSKAAVTQEKNNNMNDRRSCEECKSLVDTLLTASVDYALAVSAIHDIFRKECTPEYSKFRGEVERRWLFVQNASVGISRHELHHGPGSNLG